MVISKSNKGNLKKGQKVAGIAFWLESSIVVAKVIIGLLSGSLVLISDSIHSGSDILSIVTSWFGLKISQKNANKRFAYGYYKAESLGTLLISVLILFAFWDMATRGYTNLSSLSSIKIPLFALGISLIDAVALFFFGKYEIKVGKEVGAQSLIAMGEENRTHIFSSGVVFIGTLAAYYKVPYVEGVFTIVISLLILKIGLTALKSAIFTLMDVSPGAEIEEKVSAAIKSVPGVEEFFDLRLRESGAFIFGETKVGIRRLVDVRRSHEIADLVEERVKREVSQIDSFTVHVEPFKSNFQHLAIPVIEKKGLDSKIAMEFSRAPYFLFVNIEGKDIKGHYILDNPYKEKDVRAGLSVSKLIAKQKTGVLIVSEIGEISFYALRENLVDIYKFQDGIARDGVREFINNGLTKAERAEIKDRAL